MNQSELSHIHYRITPPQGGMPNMGQLLRTFGRSRCSNLYDGRDWQFDESCPDLDRGPNERVVYLHKPARSWNLIEMAEWGRTQRIADADPQSYRFGNRGYRLADPIDLYAFYVASCPTGGSKNIIGGGSFVVDGQVSYVSCLWWFNGEPHFDVIERDFQFRPDQSALFVVR